MTNREKYAEKILEIACSGHCIAIDKETMKLTNCGSINSCSRCYFDTASYDSCSLKCQKWCESEYIEPPVDWSKVPVDTPILVRDSENDEWIRRYYAGLSSEGSVRTWSGGRTSWSSYDDEHRYATEWKYARLAEDGGKNEME